MCKVCERPKHKLFSQEFEYLLYYKCYEVYQWMYLVYNRFSLAIVYCINLLEAQPSLISIYIEYLLEKKYHRV